MSQFSRLLHQYRLREGLSQAALARACGCKPQYISNVERGVAPFAPRRIKKLARVLGTKPFVFKNAMLKDYKRHLDSIVR